MRTYVVKVFGWMAVIEAESKREAVSRAKALAPSASLLSTDVNASHVRRASEDDIAWHAAMSGGAP